MAVGITQTMRLELRAGEGPKQRRVAIMQAHSQVCLLLGKNWWIVRAGRTMQITHQELLLGTGLKVQLASYRRDGRCCATSKALCILQIITPTLQRGTIREQHSRNDNLQYCKRAKRSSQTRTRTKVFHVIVCKQKTSGTGGMFQLSAYRPDASGVLLTCYHYTIWDLDADLCVRIVYIAL